MKIYREAVRPAIPFPGTWRSPGNGPDEMRTSITRSPLRGVGTHDPDPLRSVVQAWPPQKPRLTTTPVDEHGAPVMIFAGYGEPSWHSRRSALRPPNTASSPTEESAARPASGSRSSSAMIKRLAAHGWTSVAKRLREIEHALKEEDAGRIDERSLSTLERVLRQAPSIPQPRLGAGADGMLSAVWSFCGDGVFAAEFLRNGTVGCAAVLDVPGDSYSEELRAEDACTLLTWVSKLRLLKRR